MINFKVGIMGTGNIAGKIADTLAKLDDFEVSAIASRTIDTANAFADKYNIEKRYGSYEELTKDPDVELIYVATPHSNHAELAKMCINAGKPVLVEKAFSYNAQTTAEVLKLSKEKNVFCGEAMWIRFLPVYKILGEALKKGVIGRINSINCSLGYDLKGKERLEKLELAGGALLDLGVYPLNVVFMAMGDSPMTLTSRCAKLETGVDAQDVMAMLFKNGTVASLFTTMLYQPDNNGYFYGDNGYIEIHNINNPDHIYIYQNDHKLAGEIVPPSKQISGYEYEFIEARNAIITGKIECPEMTHVETLYTMQVMDSMRKIWKIQFPMEETEASAEAPAED